jgi:maltose alpha-D-glucosyltransferase/alpha-amylase
VGAISKLDYLEELGVTAVWILPFYPSPLRDDGYDIADYTGVNPSYGTIEDVQRFINEAHKRNIRVITELVINHTSDQHAWFQRARKAPKGSPERDFYVWSDTPDKYSGVRSIFKDFEPSNWTFDHQAGQYYWHRFFHHQPDLNFDNPAVHQAVFDTLDFWMKLGVDGLRLDAVPYLYEREGTSCENLEETHGFLKKLRTHVDKHWPGRMLLAEANQWPEDAIAYFGQGEGDECHMNFHFPLMPRLFMSLRMEDRVPIIDILEQTPPIPPTAQWAMFLRNHDELTLEMVTDEERDYMWRVYASDPVARINMGIRRRLAPLLENNRRKIELLNALLFSMPGTPVVYYGDEIGMGDNIFLGDRNGVRTPMQWSSDRNGGFSRANPQRLFLPLIIDPEYHYESINVESQSANPSSLLWWMKRLVTLRKNNPVLGRGDIKFLSPSNSKILAFLRRDESQSVLVVANLSRFCQPVELDLADFKGSTPVEMFGHVHFPAIGESGKYTLALGPHSFYYLALEPATQAAADAPAVTEAKLNISGDTLLDDDRFERLLEARLPKILPTRRWFVSKARTVRSTRVLEKISIGEAPMSLSSQQRMLFIVEVEFTDGEPEQYAIPLTAQMVDPAATVAETGILMRVVDGSERHWLVQDGMSDPDFARELMRMAMEGAEIDGVAIRVAGRRIGGDSTPVDVASMPAKVSSAEQSNSNVSFDNRYILKLYRKLGEGINPELEVGEQLTVRGFANTAPIAGAIELVSRRGNVRQTLALVLTFVPNEGDAWQAFLDHGLRFFEGLDSVPPEQIKQLCLPGDTSCQGSEEGPPPAIVELIAAPLEHSRLLGRRTAEMHASLADESSLAFAPEPSSPTAQRSLLQSMRNTTRATMQTLTDRVSKLQGPAKELGSAVLASESRIMNLFQSITSRPIRAPRIRVHGDYHLGQVLWTGKDFVIIDFEGEPLRSVGERRLKRSPMRDVAGMVRSFDYAAWTSLKRHAELRPAANQAVAERDRYAARVWGAWMSHEFVRAYVIRLRELRPDLLPESAAEVSMLLKSWTLEKALYEVRYELNTRPDWVEIPLQAIRQLITPENASADAKGGAL